VIFDGGMNDRTTVQRKTFTRWVNVHLFDRKLQIEDIVTGFHSGVMLINLVEIISSKLVPRWNKNPKMPIHKLENINKALEFLKREAITLVNIGSQDIMEGNVKCILGLVWTLILRYQIQKGSAGNSKLELMEWVNTAIAPYGVTTVDFTTSYSDARVLCGLVNALQEGQFDMESVAAGDAVDCVNQAMQRAESKFDIPQLMDAVDMVTKPDDLSVMSYISYFRDKWHELEALKLVDPSRSFATGPGLTGDGSNVNAPPNAPPIPFTVHCLNLDNAYSHAGVQCKAELMGPNSRNIPVAVHNNNDGTFACSYPCGIPPGQYRLSVALNGLLIKDMPLLFSTKPGANARRSYCDGPGLRDGLETDADSRHFSVFCCGDNGALMRGCLLSVSVVGPNGENVKTEVAAVCVGAPQSQGSYSVTYAPVGAGVYVIDVAVSGSSLPKMPLSVVLAKAACAQKSDELVCSFTVKARDAKGIPCHSGGDDFVVCVVKEGGEQVEVLACDHDDGSYSATYTLAKGHLYTVTSHLNGQQMPNCPFFHDMRMVC